VNAPLARLNQRKYAVVRCRVIAYRTQLCYSVQQLIHEVIVIVVHDLIAAMQAGKAGHSSEEDAITALQLAQLKVT
jgi:hypothetical protein